MVNRAEIEKTVEPIIQKCRKKFAPGSSETGDSPHTEEPLRPERCEMESNNSGYRGNSGRSWVRRVHRMYEYLEGKLGILGGLGDTWHMAFRKTAATPPKHATR